MCLKNRQSEIFKSFLVIILVIFSPVHASTEENFLNSQLLRMKDKFSPIEVINPFIASDKQSFGGSLNLTGTKNIYDFYKDISSKNQTLINQKLQQSFGTPYSFLGKANIYGKTGFENLSLAQNFHIDMGGSFYLTDPVFPEITTMLFQNYGASTEFSFAFASDYKIQLALNYGKFRILQKKLTVGDLAESKPSFKLKKQPYRGYLMLDLNGEYNLFNVVKIIAKINSVPLIKQEYELFNSYLGFITEDILSSSFKAIDHVKLYAGYSPFYRGNYSVKRTIVLGANFGISSWLVFDVFTTDDMYLGGQIKIGFNGLNIAFYTYKLSYDDYGIYTFRNNGLSLNFNF